MTGPTARAAQIAHVLFLDIVGYSRASTSAQGRLLEQLNAAVSASAAFTGARAAGGVRPIPTGDGMVLLFTSDVIAPAQCAVEVCRALECGRALPVRMGIHSGLVQTQIDIAGRENVVGEGINTAQRVMDFGEAGHILLSVQYAAWLRQFDDWAPSVHRLGVGSAKHGQQVELYSLHGPDFGRADPPPQLGNLPAGSPAAAVRASSSRRVALLYKPSLRPDEDVLHTLEQQLRANGYEVFVDSEPKINAAWARAIEEPIRRADAVIAIVSPRALRSEMLEFEIETAHDQQMRTGKPILLPVIIGEAEPLEGAMAAILGPLESFVWSSPQDDQKLVVALLSAIAEPLKPRAEEVKLEPVGGAVPPDSPFYVHRSSDQEFMAALEAAESLLLVKGARQIGKTSMLAQGTRRARELGWRCGLTDFQKVNAAQMASEERFYRLLAATLARQLGFEYDFAREWDEIFGANLNMENFLRELLEASDAHLVWFMDEVDKLFTAPFASDFFGLVRSWHNSRSTEAGGPWQKLTVIIAYATEAHLFIQDLNQSPFNVGRRLDLEDFNLQQTIDLNGRYGGPLRSYAECEALHALIEGQPFLTRRALDALATGRRDFGSLMEQAPQDSGPFGDHLQRILVAVSRLPEVTEYVRSVLAGAAPPHQDAYYRLLSAGIIKQSRAGQVVFRCELYRRYLQGHL
jgi:class 3 adenylate cyclase